MIENQNIKNNVLKEENEEIRQISEKQKNFYLDRIRELEIKNAELVEEVNLSKRQQEGMTKLFQKEKETLILDYEFKINKMHEKASQKISYCRQKSEEHFKNLSKNLEKSVLNYLETTKDNVTNFNNRVQADSHDLILSKSMEINNGNSRFSSPKNTKKILDQSLNNSSFSNKKTSSGKKNLGNSKFIKI